MKINAKDTGTTDENNNPILRFVYKNKHYIGTCLDLDPTGEN